MITVRNAQEKDAEQIINLLKQVLELHAKLRPDIFIPGTTKYTTSEVIEIIHDEKRRNYVAVDESDKVIGYALCVIKQQPVSNNMIPFTTLYIDDLCVDEDTRGKHVWTMLFEYIKNEAKNLGCYEIVLNVWEGNSAKEFYTKMGMKTKSTLMELILKWFYVEYSNSELLEKCAEMMYNIGGGKNENTRHNTKIEDKQRDFTGRIGWKSVCDKAGGVKVGKWRNSA